MNTKASTHWLPDLFSPYNILGETQDGFALYSKRLEQGTFQCFQWPKTDQKDAQKQSIQLSDQELLFILKDIQLESVKLRKCFQLKT